MDDAAPIWQDAAEHARRASKHYEAGRWFEALREIQRAVQMEPNEALYQRGLGLTLEALRRYEDAVQAFEVCLELSQGPMEEDIDTLLRLGVNLIRLREHERAIDVLEHAACLEPDCYDAYVHRIIAFAQANDFEEAEVMFYLAVQLDEYEPIAYDHMAHAMLRKGDLDRAEVCWNTVEDLDSEYPNLYANLARLQQRRGDLDEAISTMQLHLDLNPGDLRATVELGRLFGLVYQYDKAEECFSEAGKLTTNTGEIEIHRGEIALLRKDYDTAAISFTNALKQLPERSGIRLGLSMAWRGQSAELKPEAKAIVNQRIRERLIEELASAHHSPRQLLELSRLLIEYELPQRAAALLRATPDSTWRNEEDRAEAKVLYGTACLALDRVDEGIDACRESVRMLPDRVLPYRNLVLAYADQGKLTRAKAWLRRLERRWPNDGELSKLRQKVR